MNDGFVVLDDGTVWRGHGFGASGVRIGALRVFHGDEFVEFATNPANSGLICVFNAKTIGSCGVNTEHAPSGKCRIAGVVCAETQKSPKHWRNAETADHFVRRHSCPGVEGIDITALAAHIAKHNISKCAVVNGNAFDNWNILAARIKSFSPNYSFSHGVSSPESYGSRNFARVAVCDFGCSADIIRLLNAVKLQAVLLPSNGLFSAVSRGGYDGLIIGDCPGEPKHHPGFVSELTDTFSLNLPTLALGAGAALAAAALGAAVTPLATPHCGSRIPVKRLANGLVFQSFQNHTSNIEPNNNILTATYLSLTDNTIDGFLAANKPVMGSFALPCFPPECGGTDIVLQDFSHLVRRHLSTEEVNV